MRFSHTTKYFISGCLFGGLVLLGAGCSSGGNSGGSTNGSELSASDASVGNAVSSTLNTVALSLNPTTEDASTTASLQSALVSGLGGLGVAGCSDSDPNVTVTAACDDTAHTATVLRDFNAGCATENREGDTITVTGEQFIGWTDMGNASCTAPDQRPIFWAAVQGQGAGAPATQLISTDPNDPSNPAQAIVRSSSDGTSLDVMGDATRQYSDAGESGDVRSVNEEVTIPGTSRIRYQADGTTKIFDHTVSTESPLEIHLQQTAGAEPIRTIDTGTVALSHNLAKFTVHSSFQNVEYDYNQCECHPVSGTVAISVTDNMTSNEIGSGTVTFTGCGSESFTYSGRTVRLPSFDSCR